MARPKKVNDTFSRLWQVLRHFTPELRKEKSLIAGSVVALFASVTLRLLEPWPLMIVLDHILEPEGSDRAVFPSLGKVDPTTLLTFCAVSFVIVVALRAISDYYRTVGFALIGNRVMGRIRGQLYRHLQALSLSFHNKARSGDLLVRVIGDIKLMRDVVVTALLPLVGSVLLLLGMVGVMFYFNWRLTLLALLVVPLFALSTVRLGRRIHAAARKQRQREGAMAATASEAIASVQVVQSLSLEKHFESNFSSQNQRSLSEGVQTRRLAARLERTTDVLVAVATASVLWYGAQLVLTGPLSTGKLITFLAYLKRGFRPMQDFAKYTARLAKATAAGERIVELLEETPDIQDMPDAQQAPTFRGKLQFSEIRFGYDPTVLVYEGLSFSVEAGRFVAVVGDSGAGKSTLLSLLLRLYDPLKGHVLIDGQDIRRWTVSSLRGQISVVLQDTVLFAGTVYENIALGATDVDESQIVEAAKLANAHDFIVSLPEGFETMLGERGVNLSHGQRQRLAIARAAVRNAPLLLLDEPTVGLDEKNECEVRTAIRKLAAGRTTILVTHDLRQAADADEIFYIENGSLCEAGTHQQLVDLAGRYAELYQSQIGNTEPTQGKPSRVTT